MSRSHRLALAVCLTAAAMAFGDFLPAHASSTTVVISEFRVRGPNGAADEFVELYNVSGAPVNIGGWKISGSNASGTTGTRATIPAGVSLGAGCHYLVANSSSSGGPYSGAVPSNTTFTTGITDDGGIALLDSSNGVVDAVGMSAGSAYKEGSPLASLGSSNSDRGYERKPGGSAGSGTDTDNNASDFQLRAPSDPQNLSSPCISVTPGDAAPAVTSTAPASGSVNVPVDAAITINFSEAIQALPGAFSIECPSGVSQAFTQSADTGTSLTLTPQAALPYSTTCSVKVSAAQISDVDTDDPPDTLAGDYAISFTTADPPPVQSNSVVVISQLYGGGGNSGATFRNDFVELYNRSDATVDLTGWSLQYTSAAGTSWDSNVQPLGGTMAPGQYLLVSLASGGNTGDDLPPANIYGEINMSATTGKLALVNSFDALVGNCPTGDPHVVDFVGYGSNADCREGSTNAPAPSNTRALFRAGSGATDTDRNGSDFSTATPAPRRSAPIVELGPAVLSTDPRPHGSNAPRDATIEVRFTEPVDVFDPWFDVTCTSSGPHDDATFAVDGRARYITPNVNFTPGETCTVTIFKDQVADQDLDDAAPNTNNLAADYTWSFTVASGAAPPEPSSVHLTMGNPSDAVASTDDPDNYLMTKPEYAVSYNRDLGRPNWVSWHLTDEWIGNLSRVDTFRPDPAVPPDWYRVQSFDFAGSGFDRGHMTPNADRDNEASIPINQATFLMSNMVAQAPDNNQGPWAAFENYLRSLLPANELYIVAGGTGAGGSGSNGGTTTLLAGGHVTVPAYTWKVALVLPKDGGDDVSRVSCGTRSIAVIMPNTQGIRDNAWETYLTTVDAVETLSGYDFFSNVAEPIQGCVEAGTNGNNPPLVKGTQTIAFAAPADRTYGDLPFVVSATGGKSGSPVTFAASGACSAGGADGTTITILSAGACTITASQAGSAIYEAAPDVTHVVTIHQAAPAFSALSVPTVQVGSDSVTVSGTLRAGSLVPSGSVAVSVGNSSVTAALASDGSFSAEIQTGALRVDGSPYVVSFAYAGDTNFAPAAATAALTVVDTTAPAIADFAVTPGALGAPNHKMVNVFVQFTATDAGGAPVCSLGVSSNEPLNGTGDGNTSIDWQVLDAHHAQLRAERSGTGSGRLYLLTLTCRDASGNSATASGTVAVSK